MILEKYETLWVFDLLKVIEEIIDINNLRGLMFIQARDIENYCSKTMAL